MEARELRYGVLGALELHRDGVPVPLPSGRQRAVLAALLVAANRPVRADQLAEAAWAGGLPADPKAALHTVLSRLRATLAGERALRSVPTGYVLDVATDALDAARFESLCARAADVPPREALELLDAALRLWRGPAYAEFSDRDFAQAEAVRLDELRLAAAEDRAGGLLELGDAEAAAVVLEGLVTEHPLRERGLGRLMTALYRAGRPTEALDRYQQHRRLLADQLGLDPSPALRDLEMRILGHDLRGQDLRGQGLAPRAAAPGRAGTAPSGRLRPPVWLAASTAFVGRDGESAALVEAVATRRLVTVTGVGGVGKTRLVAETLAALVERLEVPATVVELAHADADGIDAAVAAALGVGAATPGHLRAPVLEYLSITSALLVLDNCEHVLPAVSGLTGQILRRCPGVRVLATSRHRLGLADEQVLPLRPLPPPDGADMERAELAAAVRLFSDRARRARPSFALTAATLPTVVEVCRRLDGLPLAIELAATRAATLGLGPLLDRLDRSLDLLGDDGRSRQPTLRAVVDWSYELLGPDERRVFATLSVFAGGFDLDAAEQVAGALGGPPVPVVLSRLVDASLVHADDTGDAMRYRMLVIVRAFARERLMESGAERTVRRAHAGWALSVAESVARDALGPADAAAFRRLERERMDLLAAARWALDAGEAELAGGITGAVGLAGAHYLADAELLSVTRQVAAGDAVRGTGTEALALGAGARAAMMQGDLDAAQHLAGEALEVAATVTDRCLALHTLGVTALYRGDHERSAGWWRELLATGGHPVVYDVDAHTALALIACWRGELDTARAEAATATACAEATGVGARAFAAYTEGEVALVEAASSAVPLLEAATAGAHQAGIAFVAGLAETALVSALTRLGRFDAALEVAGPLLQHWRRLGAWPQLWTALRIVAELLVALERDELAALLLAAADRAPSAPAVTGADAGRYRDLWQRLRERVDAAALDRIGTLAQALPRAQVVDRALAAVGGTTG